MGTNNSDIGEIMNASWLLSLVAAIAVSVTAGWWFKGRHINWLVSDYRHKNRKLALRHADWNAIATTPHGTTFASYTGLNPQDLCDIAEVLRGGTTVEAQNLKLTELAKKRIREISQEINWRSRVIQDLIPNG